nr:hypothetical protein BaRGS_028585 [Batillaria attramentaria]
MECHYNFTVEWYRTLTKVCEGDTVVVAVTNMLEDGLSTSIHWHGQHMHGTPYMDGMGQVTQCHIQHMETFTYKFKAGPAGSHWYHAHTGMQFADGLFGAIIVRQPPNYDPNSNLYDLDLPEHVVLVHDWMSEFSMSRYVTMMHDWYNFRLPRSVLVNGRGRQYNVTGSDGAHAQTPLEVLHVQRGKKYRLRIIAAAPACPLQVSVDDHQLMVIAVDGERYDFVLDASKDAENYWLRVFGLWYCEFSTVISNGGAILRYEGAPEVEPSGHLNQQRDGILLNPILFDNNVTEYGWNREVIRTDDMRYAYDSNYTDEVVDFKYFLGMDFNYNDNSKYGHKELYPVRTHSTPVIDNITFSLPPVPILSQPEDVRGEWFCNRSTIPDHDYCQTEDLCMCTHMIRVKLNQVVELVVFHEGRFFTERGHNMHLHGHKFRLLGLNKVGKALSRSTLEQMDARGELRRNYIKPPVRDTVNVPDGGYAIIRFTASNPAKSRLYGKRESV